MRDSTPIPKRTGLSIEAIQSRRTSTRRIAGIVAAALATLGPAVAIAAAPQAVVQAAPAAPEAGFADKPGKWELGGGATLEIIRKSTGKDEGSPVAIVHWPASREWPALRYELTIVNDAADPWAIAWQKGGNAFWIVDQTSVRGIHFENPAQIRLDFEGRNNNTNFDAIPQRACCLRRTGEDNHRFRA